MIGYEDGIYLIEVSVDWDGRVEFGNCDPSDRVLYCKDCDNSELSEHGNRVCCAWDHPELVEDYEWCSRRVRRHDGK